MHVARMYRMDTEVPQVGGPALRDVGESLQLQARPRWVLGLSSIGLSCSPSTPLEVPTKGERFAARRNLSGSPLISLKTRYTQNSGFTLSPHSPLQPSIQIICVNRCERLDRSSQIQSTGIRGAEKEVTISIRTSPEDGAIGMPET